MLKTHLRALLTEALGQLKDKGVVPNDTSPDIHVERARDRNHGDFASNLAMALARAARCKPRELAEGLVSELPHSDLLANVSIAGPGFLNFRMADEAYHGVVRDAIERGEAFGKSQAGKGRRLQVEFVSANPTGPLHVGHGRGAAYGATVANLLEAVGFDVQREYYVNDAGRQMHILAASMWLRYLELCGVSVAFPSNGYKGAYVRDIAQTLRDEHGDDYAAGTEAMFTDLPADAPDGGDKEAHIDALVVRARAILGENRYRYVYELALNTILDDIRDDLQEFGVEYGEWYSERSLTEKGLVNKAIEVLRSRGQVYERDGALWFRSSEYGDEKDRVVQRENGQTTYFASDIAYHMDKLQRGFDRVIDVWGADHHGYVPRMKAALHAMGDHAERLDVLLVQFAVLYRGGEKVQMSTRSGEFVTLRELREEVGTDAARFFYVMRKCEQHLDFDLDLAKSRSNENPVYYIQYAHARICSVARQLGERGFEFDQASGAKALPMLTEKAEKDLLYDLSRYPEVVETAAFGEDPHVLAHFLRTLANDFHVYYNAHPFLVEAEPLRNARLSLIFATRQALSNGLALLGVSAPERM